MLAMVSLAVACGWAQELGGRWDGTITYGALNVPFIIHFEPNGKKLTGSFVNGDTLSFANTSSRRQMPDIGLI